MPSGREVNRKWAGSGYEVDQMARDGWKGPGLAKNAWEWPELSVPVTLPLPPQRTKCDCEGSTSAGHLRPLRFFKEISSLRQITFYSF